MLLRFRGENMHDIWQASAEGQNEKVGFREKCFLKRSAVALTTAGNYRLEFEMRVSVSRIGGFLFFFFFSATELTKMSKVCSYITSLQGRIRALGKGSRSCLLKRRYILHLPYITLAK